MKVKKDEEKNHFECVSVVATAQRWNEIEKKNRFVNLLHKKKQEVAGEESEKFHPCHSR